MANSKRRTQFFDDVEADDIDAYFEVAAIMEGLDCLEALGYVVRSYALTEKGKAKLDMLNKCAKVAVKPKKKVPAKRPTKK